MEIDPEGLEKFFEFMAGHLDEKQRRLVAGGIARLLGRGGLTAVAGAAGCYRQTLVRT
jgi:DNA-binding phage protein